MWLLFWPKFVIGFSLAIVMFLVQKLVGHYTGLTFERDDYAKGWSFVLAVVVVAPLVEEGLFRGVLKPRAGQLAVVTFLLTACVVGHNYGEWPVRKLIQLPVAVGLLAGLPLLVYRWLRIPQRMAGLQRVWQAHFRLIFYVVAIGFGLVHLSNYQELTGWHYLMAPLLTLPQLFAGFYLGYVRMTYGMWYGIALHAIWNVLPASLTIAHLLTH
ncbi:MAG: CPBP family intramembrane metalloprotease [Bacteroidetes bacterium]|nr:CPBP family intramembrane metalloprotease [Fibrella sp.]